MRALGWAAPSAGATSSMEWALRLGYARALSAITAVGVLARVVWIVRQPLGYDEDFTAVVAHQPLGRMLDVVSRDSGPPLFYIAERVTAALADLVGIVPFGAPGGPIVLRIVPAVAGIALIPLVAALARRVAGDGAGLCAALVVAIAPASVVLSGFARMYGLAAALAAAAVLLLWRALERPSRRRWAAYAAAAAGSVWTSYFGAVALLGILAAGLWLRPSRRQGAVAVGTTILAAGSIAPWLLVARAQLEHAGEGFWVPPLGPTMLAGTAAQLFAGPAVDGRLPSAPMLAALQAAAVLAGVACLAAVALAWRGLGSEGRRAVAFCLLAASGIGILAAVSIWRPLLDARYAGVMWMPLFALAGVGLSAMSGRWALVALVAMAAPTMALGATVTNPETASLVPELDARAADHDLVAASWDHYLVILDEGSPEVRARLHVLSGSGLPWYVGSAAYPPGAEIHSIPADVVAARGRIFWVADPGVDPPSLPSGYRLLGSRCVTLVCLTIFGPEDR